MRTVYNFSPALTDSVFRFRIELAKKRLRSYPLETLDFTMIDLERPEHRYRHAHQCTTDLTGRTIEFLAEAQTVLPKEDDTYIYDLFRRMSLKGDQYAFARRYVPYFLYTNDPSAYEAITKVMDGWVKELHENPVAFSLRSSCDCYIEGLALMYEYTGNEGYADVARAMVRPCLAQFSDKNNVIGNYAHMHGMLTVLRAVLLLARVTGDDSLAELVNIYRLQVRDNVYADGAVAECFPRSYRNEGCAIADWVMLCLRYYAVTGDETALDDAEHSLLNALFFNQFITGGFGHRSLSENVYGTNIEEAWWCCTQTGGMAMCEFCKSAVQYVESNGASGRKGVIKILFPVPGVYTLTADGKPITVTVVSAYPAAYNINVRVIGDTTIPVEFREPYYAKNMNVTEHRMKTQSDTRVFTVTADIGHYAEMRDGAYVMKYGPLVLAPMIYDTNCFETGASGAAADGIQTVPEGYIREALDGGPLCIAEPDAADRDENGFWRVASGDNLPVWLCFDDGPTSRTGTNNRAAANITLVGENGYKKELCFHPLAYATSNLTLYNVPVTFGLAKSVSD